MLDTAWSYVREKNVYLPIFLLLTLILTACQPARREEPAAAPAAQAPPAAETSTQAEGEPLQSSFEVKVGTPVSAQARGESRSAHVALTGSYVFDKDAFATCAYFPNKSFQVSFQVERYPFVVLKLENFQGAGDYDAQVWVRGNYSGEVVKISRGPIKAKIVVAPTDATTGKSQISGSFEGTYKGEAGSGTAVGRFENCLYELAEKNEG